MQLILKVVLLEKWVDCKFKIWQTFDSYKGVAALVASIIWHLTGVTPTVCNQKVYYLQSGNSIFERDFIFFSTTKLSLITEPVDVKFGRSFNGAL